MALEYPDGWGINAWHGTRVPARIIEAPESLTPEEIRTERNSEVSRALAERLGTERYLEAMGAIVVDGYTDERTGLRYDLLDLKERRGDRQPRWLRMTSPVVKDGTQPVYVEKVHPECSTAKAARRWQFRKTDGEWPTPAEANRNPELTFAKEA